MKVMTIFSVVVGVRGSGKGCDRFTIGYPSPLIKDRHAIVTGFELWDSEDGRRYGVKVFKGDRLLIYKSVNQPYTLEYVDAK